MSESECDVYSVNNYDKKGTFIGPKYRETPLLLNQPKKSAVKKRDAPLQTKLAPATNPQSTPSSETSQMDLRGTAPPFLQRGINTDDTLPFPDNEEELTLRGNNENTSKSGERRTPSPDSRKSQLKTKHGSDLISPIRPLPNPLRDRPYNFPKQQMVHLSYDNETSQDVASGEHNASSSDLSRVERAPPRESNTNSSYPSQKPASGPSQKSFDADKSLPPRPASQITFIVPPPSSQTTSLGSSQTSVRNNFQKNNIQIHNIRRNNAPKGNTQRSIIPTKRKNRPKKLIKKDAISEICRLQRSTQLCIPRVAFSRTVREICKDICQEEKTQNKKWQSAALEALQVSAEFYLETFFMDSYLCAIHAKRVTLKKQDMELVKIVRSRHNPL